MSPITPTQKTIQEVFAAFQKEQLPFRRAAWDYWCVVSTNGDILILNKDETKIQLRFEDINATDWESQPKKRNLDRFDILDAFEFIKKDLRNKTKSVSPTEIIHALIEQLDL